MKRHFLVLCISIFTVLSLSAADLIHVIRKGETLYSLARTYNVDVDDIIRANEIDNPAMISIGAEIRIPSLYVVEKGDTFYSLAKRFDTSTDELYRLNEIDSSRVLIVGERILVPGTLAEQLPGEPAEHSEPSTEQEQEQERIVQPDSGSKPFFWPHAGQSARMTGKLEGLQFEGKDGDAVISVSNGKVVWVGPYRGYNKIVFVQTISDYIYGYGGNNDILVKVGDRVEPGTEIGRLGINPHEGKARMFFFVYRNGVAVDPYTAPRE